MGKTTLAEALLHRAGVTTPGRHDRGRQQRHSTREPEEIARRIVDLARDRPVRLAGERRQHLSRSTCSTRPAIPISRPTSTPRSSVADLAIIVDSATDGIEVGTESAWRKCVGARPAADDLRDPRGQAPRRLPRACSPSCASVFGPGVRAARAAARRGGGVPRRRRRAHRAGARVRRPTGGTTPSRCPTTSPTRSTRSTTSSIEEIVSGDDAQLEQLPDGRDPDDRRPRAHARRRGARVHRVPGARRFRSHRRRRRPTRRLHLRARAVAGRPAVDGDRRRQRDRGQRRSGRRTARLRLQDRRRPVRRPDLAVQGPVRHAPQRRPPRRGGDRHRRAHARLFHLRGSRAHRRQPARRRRHRRRRQARLGRRPAARSRRRASRCACERVDAARRRSRRWR